VKSSRNCRRLLPTRDYHLAATLDSGQSFAWTHVGDAWEGVIQQRWVRLQQVPGGIEATVTWPEPTVAYGRACLPPSANAHRHPCLVHTPEPPTRAGPAPPSADWSALTDYLQTEVELPAILATFPPDPPLLEAARCCGGLRILRQDPWECLASFLLSATKQIVQIRQVVAALCRQFGSPVSVPPGHPPAFAFPPAQAIANTTEPDLRQCRMGFRARHLHEAARRIVRGDLDLLALRTLPLEQARAQLLKLPGIGPKIADCVLLFSGDQPRAFPIDVWVARALRHYYFAGRRVPAEDLRRFAATHFGPWAGHAQQFLFHYARQHVRLTD
jgi:N-glycosylase/DNA lyase